MLALLFAVAVLGVGMAALGTLWATAAKREKETELLFIGDQFRLAIQSYRQRTPGAEKHYPKSLQDLLEDRRFPMPVRYLRRIYRDPLTGKAQWGLIKDKDGYLTGVYSLSEGKPLKVGNFPLPDAGFTGRTSYRDWVFAPAQDSGTSQRAEQVGMPNGVAHPAADSPAAATDQTTIRAATSEPQAGADAQSQLACRQVRQEGYAQCVPLRSSDTPAAYQACMVQVQQAYLACMQRG